MTSQDKFNPGASLPMYFNECKELLEIMQASLFKIREGIYEKNTIFCFLNAIHTINIISRMFRIETITRFTGTLEETLDIIKNNNTIIGDQLVSILFECNDHINRMVTEIENNKDHTISKQTDSLSQGLVEKIQLYFNSIQMDRETIPEYVQKEQPTINKTNLIKINAEKLDTLINLVGELVITGATIKQLHANKETNRSAITKSLSIMSRLIENIRDNTMNMRMIQIEDTFKKFERIVIDLSREQNKEIDLVLEGCETKLDRNLIKKITDPLMHLVKNAVDHGIEHPAEREKSKKPRRGQITLKAYKEAGNFVLNVIDDGKGLNKHKIYAEALKSGRIKKDTKISDQELFQFIFEKGFSTVDKTPNTSGRSIGMDVVKTNIESLRGSIVLNSTEGFGTSVKIYLPLTLAIIDGFLVKVDKSFYVIPLNLVNECIEVTREQVNINDGGSYINLRGEVLAFIKLRSFFYCDDNGPDLQSMIIVDHKGSKVGIVVDKLIGEFQTVIKPLGDIFNNLLWINGGTILGNGEVAIILDIPKLLDHTDLKAAVSV